MARDWFRKFFGSQTPEEATADVLRRNAQSVQAEQAVQREREEAARKAATPTQAKMREDERKRELSLAEHDRRNAVRLALEEVNRFINGGYGGAPAPTVAQLIQKANAGDLTPVESDILFRLDETSEQWLKRLHNVSAGTTVRERLNYETTDGSKYANLTRYAASAAVLKVVEQLIRKACPEFQEFEKLCKAQGYQLDFVKGERSFVETISSGVLEFPDRSYTRSIPGIKLSLRIPLR